MSDYIADLALLERTLYRHASQLTTMGKDEPALVQVAYSGEARGFRTAAGLVRDLIERTPR